MKYFISLLLFLFFCYGYAQRIKLEPNVNPNASELKHWLNNSGDSLFLKSDYKIYSVEFINPTADYKKLYNTYDNEVKLPLDDIPFGRLVISVKLNKKYIVFNVVKTEEVKKNYIPITDLLNKKTLNSDTLITSSPTFKRKPLRMYWAIHSVDKNLGTYSTSELIDEKRKDYLIRKNKADLKSYTGSDNRLVIWEVYDVEQFMTYKRISNGFLVRSVGFNPEPIYISEK